MINLAFYGLIFALSLYFQQIKNFTSLLTGLAFMPMTAIVIVANIVAGQISAHLGARSPMVLGQAIFAFGCLFLVAIDANTSYGGLWGQTVMIRGRYRPDSPADDLGVVGDS